MGRSARAALIGVLAIIGMGMQMTAQTARAEILREDFTVVNEEGMRLFVRELRDTEGRPDRGPMLLVNGGRPGALASWDVDASLPSTAEELAKAGHRLYLMDVRGFGLSDFPSEMERGRFEAPVAVRSDEAVRDIDAVIREIRRRNPGDGRLAAMGWATGSQWLGHYASLHPTSIDRLIYYNAAYGGPAGGWRLQADFADPKRPADLDYSRHGAWRLATADDLVGRWRNEGVDPAFLDRYVALAMKGDTKASLRTPPSFRFPTGPVDDTLKMVNGRQLFDASFIRSHVLILRSQNDFWARPTDAQTLLSHLTNAASARLVELPGASHYVHLLPSAERRKFLDAVLESTAPSIRSEKP
ncbi:alpha/beta hydrolase fold protein [Rhodomicrobium vannielii ATCC 17100]|uniref:Alpha/beta hydrolase fold protein n=2 Tax=Rhodomicrobium vannielii TaxID=1069 RepID=E3I292_RHOVT|nr:alpha/beta hydrolase fold protein [Rhodomicrobium vannielii ATCC 17100]